jgi:hypothetical protein
VKVPAPVVTVPRRVKNDIDVARPLVLVQNCWNDVDPVTANSRLLTDVDAKKRVSASAVEKKYHAQVKRAAKTVLNNSANRIRQLNEKGGLLLLSEAKTVSVFSAGRIPHAQILRIALHAVSIDRFTIEAAGQWRPQSLNAMDMRVGSVVPIKSFMFIISMATGNRLERLMTILLT